MPMIQIRPTPFKTITICRSRTRAASGHLFADCAGYFERSKQGAEHCPRQSHNQPHSGKKVGN
jgi:hypothetical protein